MYRQLLQQQTINIEEENIEEKGTNATDIEMMPIKANDIDSILMKHSILTQKIYEILKTQNNDYKNTSEIPHNRNDETKQKYDSSDSNDQMISVVDQRKENSAYNKIKSASLSALKKIKNTSEKSDNHTSNDEECFVV